MLAWRTHTKSSWWVAGLPGVAAAKKLGRKGVRVLLIDSNNYHQFQPLLYQLATSQIGVSAITRPLRSVFPPGYKTRHGSQTASIAFLLMLRNRSVTTSDGVTLRAEILVIAVGARSQTSSTPQVPSNTLSRWYSVTDATRLGTRPLRGLLDQADRTSDGLVDVVVVGGGPTGVETAGAMAENVKI